jgi:hypothetical protein
MFRRIFDTLGWSLHRSFLRQAQDTESIEVQDQP